MRRVVSLCPARHRRHAPALDQLAAAMRKRYDQTGKIEDVEEEITLHKEALQLRPEGHSDRPKSLNNLAKIIRVRFEMLGRSEDLEEAIGYAREALSLALTESDERARALGSLGGALAMLFEHAGDMKDLEAAIECFQEMLRICPQSHPGRSGTLNDVANAMRTRFRETGKMEDLGKAVEFSREALSVCPAGDRERPLVLGNLASTLLTRFTQNGSMEDLEESIDLIRQALSLQPEGHPDRPLTLGHLPVAILFRFGETGKTEDLEDCIQLFRESLSLFHEGHADRAMALSNLSSAILARFQQVGRIEDADEGIKILRETLRLLPDDHPYRSEALMNLAAATVRRFELTPAPEALNEAIDLYRQALDFLPPEHTYRPAVMQGYSGALRKRFQLSGEAQDLDQAISLNDEALGLWPSGHPERCASLKELALTLLKRFELSSTDTDMERAYQVASKAEEELPADHPLHADIRASIAAVLLKMHSVDPADGKRISAAFDYFQRATTHTPASVKARFTVALERIASARECRDSSVISAYAISLSLLTRFLITNPSVELQHKFFRSTAIIPKTLASDAAAAAIEAGQLDIAVEFLEQGRTILWSEMRNFRPPLEQLREANAEYADQLQDLTTQLEHQATSSEATPMPNESPVPLEVRQKNYRILSERFDELLGQIRELKGFTHFLDTVSFQTLRTAASEGPVIIINISQYRSDAIIIHETQDAVLVPLPAIEHETLAGFASFCSDPQSTRADDLPKKLRQVLQALWRMVVGPVVDHLSPTLPTKSRIWWCPTSHLCALPLHAAGPYLPKQRNLPDLYISSYTSTLSVLMAARSRPTTKTTKPELLVIADTGQPGSEIPSVEQALQQIRKYDENAHITSGKDATKENILSSLPHHRWVHFACHGHREQESFHSWFQLYDNQRLELLDLIHARLPNAELAFLSACHAAAVDAQGTPDEVIHLAGALQFCGFRSVIGTLWAMADVDGPDVANDFYGYMIPQNGSLKEFMQSAEGLNVVTKEMRKRKIPLDRWRLSRITQPHADSYHHHPPQEV
ncbi:hypothetical protein V5O48_006686 [Marasmius crinis-equi]|uniref:CHAT domain-containing protein n=1 Tax=Marasmius crinis-equi TaxID=585013 RepID=A0ABR3FIT7_9AGAR